MRLPMSEGALELAPTPTPTPRSTRASGPDIAPAPIEVEKRTAESSGLQTPEDAAFGLESYWNAVASRPLSERLALFRSLYSKSEIVLQKWRDELERRGVVDRSLQDAGIARFREQQLQLFMMEIRADPVATEPELFKFRTTYDRKDPVLEQMAQSLYKSMGAGFAASMRTQVRQALASVTGPEVGPRTYRLLANQAMNPFANHDKEFDFLVRSAFYDESKELVKATQSADLATGLINAVGSAMTSRYDDPRVIDEAGDFARDMRLLVRAMPLAHQQQVSDAESDLRNTTTKMLNHRVTLHDVQLRYIASVIAIKDAFQSVGEEWVAMRTQSLRDRIGSIDKVREMLGRAVNVGWAKCAGPASAIPTVVIGMLADVALEVEEEVLKRNLADLESDLRATLSRKLSGSLSRLYGKAQEDAERIGANDLPLIEKMPSITTIEKTFEATLRAELSKVPS